MKGMRNTTLIAAMVLTLAAFGCSSTNDQVVDNADGTVQNDSPTIASNADANLGAAAVPTGGVDADARTMADGATNARIGNATNTNQVTPSVPSQGLTVPDNRSNTVATTQVAQSTTTYNTPITSPSMTSSTSVSGTSGTSTTERVDTTATMSTTMPETSTTTTTTTVEERNLRQTTTDQSMASSAQTDDTTDDDTTTRRRMRKD